MSVEVRVAVPAPIEDVWHRWTDFARWTEWNPACVSAEAPVGWDVGDLLRLELLHPRGRAFWTAPRIRTVEPLTELRWETRGFGFRAPTVTAFEAGDSETRVSLRCDVFGPLGFTYKLTFPEKMQGLLWSGALTGLAQSFGTR